MSCLRKIGLVLAMVVSLETIGQGKEATLSYPTAKRLDQVDTYHGVEVADPYRWLEQDVRKSQEVADWIAAENSLTRRYLDAIPQRASIINRLTQLWNYERFSVPDQTAQRYFFLKNDGLQNQSVLYWSTSYADKGQELLDPNQWSEDGTVALGTFVVSEDGRRLAYTRREAGSDWSTIRVVDVETGQHLEDELRWVRFGDIVWNAQGTGFYYARYPTPEAGEKFQSSAQNQMLSFHMLGDSQDDDTLIYRCPDHPKWSFDLQRTEDDHYLVLSIHRSTDPQNMVMIRTTHAEVESWSPLVSDFNNEFRLIGNQGSKLYFLTDLEAPTKRVVMRDVSKEINDLRVSNLDQNTWQEIIPAQQATLKNVSLLSKKFIANYLQDVVSRVRVFSISGEPISEIELPGVGSAYGFDGRQSDTETFFAFTSYTTPTSIYRYNVSTGRSERIRAPQINFDPSLYEVHQEFFHSKDGTRVPMLIAHRRGLPRDGQQPTLLYGYGGFNISIQPYFSVAYVTWMEMGGVLAVPNLRGGGEYGEAWHAAGKLQNKQNVFDDFIAAALWLVDQRYTSHKKIAIMGGSNGGLLVGACMTQRPELFGACLPAVGVMDMLRFHQFTAGHFWRDEYGTVDDAQQFRTLLAYSPYHNIRPGTNYPATLVTTADTDDRVVPMHSFKFAAALQYAQAGSAPVLLRVETRAGHGAGTPISKRIDLVADRWAFLAQNLGMSFEGFRAMRSSN